MTGASNSKQKEGKKSEKVVDSKIVFKSASTSAMTQPASETMKKNRKDDAKPGSLKVHTKFGRRKKNQPSNLLQVCKESTELCTKGGFRRRHELLSEVLSS